ncbi:MAG TPA: response regulator [Vicinamibacterales bacterium]|jgi:signal transduction histidine kinase
MNSGRPNTNSSRVWLIDDDETVLLLGEEILRAEGFDVRVFSAAEPAWAATASGLPDLVILDVLMPGIGGFEFCARLRRVPGTEDVPVLMMTSLDDAESINRAFEAGATAFATKPLNWINEAHHVRYMLRAAKVARDLRKEEAENRRARDTWEKTFNAIRDVVTVLDPTLHIVQANAAAVGLFGGPAEAIGGASLQGLFPGPAGEQAEAPARETLATGRSATVELTCGRLERIWRVETAPVTGDGGSIVQVVHVARDLTNERRLESAVRQQQKLEAVGKLAGGMAHDLNNLLHIVLGHADLIEADLAPGRQIPSLTQIREAAGRGSALIGQLLTFSRHGAAKCHKEPTDANKAVASVHRMLERLLPVGVWVETFLASAPTIVDADPGQLQQAIVNLVINASQAMPDGGRLTIRVGTRHVGPDEPPVAPGAPSGDLVSIAVADTGHGMNRETMEQMYEPFFTTREAGSGPGLGLSVVYGIMRSHGGGIACTSEPGKGTVFTLYLPAAKPARAVTPAAERRPSAPQVGVSRTILVVDDEPAIRNFLQHALTRIGFSVVTAADGESGLQIYGEAPTPPDLVILDLGMPGIGGWECLKRLREAHPTATVLVATGFGGDDVTERALALGACGVAFKPYAVAELRRTIGEILARGDSTAD